MKRISNEFLINYFIVFVLTVFVSLFAFVLLNYSSTFISSDLLKNKYKVSSIIEDGYLNYDTSSIVEKGGGLQIINEEYQIIFSKGLNTFEKSQLSASEFTSFLIDSNNQNYHYDIAYNEKDNYWVVVSFPTSLRLELFVKYNKAAYHGDLIRVIIVLVIVILIYLSILAVFSYILSRMSAKNITQPLKKLCEGTSLLRQGDYSIRVNLDLENEFAQLQNTFNEMAEKIEKEVQLRENSENERKKLISDISHDLKNPLFSIIGYSEICLTNKKLEEKEINDYLKIIYKNGKRASSLITELFELSKLDNPKFNLKLEKVELSEYLRNYCISIIPQLEYKSFKYDFDIEDNEMFALIDKSNFRRVFDNLVFNCLKYNESQTTLKISLNEENDKIEIIIDDDGVGLPKEIKDNIFKPFSKSTNQEDETSVSGLGLSIAKKITLLHKGSLEYIDKTDSGSQFKITLHKI